MVREKAVKQMRDAGFDLYTLDEVMDLAKISRSTVYRSIDEGKLVTRKIGGQVRVKRKDLEVFLEGTPG